MSVSADLLLRYLLGKLWLVPPQYYKSPQIPPKPRLSHPGSSGLSCCSVTLGDKGSSSWQMVFQLACLPACLPGACIPISSKQGRHCCCHCDVWRPFLGRQAAAWATDVSAPCRLRPSAAATEPVSGLTPRVPGLAGWPSAPTSQPLQTHGMTCTGRHRHSRTHTQQVSLREAEDERLLSVLKAYLTQPQRPGGVG